MAEAETFTCPRCGMTSHNPNDARNGYCGNCHDYTAGPVGIADEPGGKWMEAILHLSEAQRLMETMSLPFPRELEMGNVAMPYAVAFKAMVHSIRQHYIVTLRMNERTPVRLVVDDEGVHVVKRDE